MAKKKQVGSATTQTTKLAATAEFHDRKLITPYVRRRTYPARLKQRA